MEWYLSECKCCGTHEYLGVKAPTVCQYCRKPLEKVARIEGRCLEPSELLARINEMERQMKYLKDQLNDVLEFQELLSKSLQHHHQAPKK